MPPLATNTHPNTVVAFFLAFQSIFFLDRVLDGQKSEITGQWLLLIDFTNTVK